MPGRCWTSGLTNARLEGMNSLFQAARSRVMAGMYNRIKVIKRLTYRYRDTVYLFLKIRAAFPAKCDKP
ncbi:hypothetical protein SAMN04488129_102241 [Halomonas daqiaonensis]|uniref:Transposase n=1 Tax=Halomonas daqiaonensis TaxID=650850 RepID=A0A1H7HK21_9GAMM|nr:hypothetical protein SAMN04488129_102241 [Halomonas daqiaonensis]